MPIAIAVLASGRGSNARALIQHQQTLGDRRAGEVACIISDRAEASVLELAREQEIHAVHLPRPDDGAAMAEVLREHGVALIVLAGYLRLVPQPVVHEWSGRIINVHPALLPAFGGRGMYGARVHSAVIASGARVSGATVHFVDEEYDRGAIIAQWPVPVLPGDDADSLARRVREVEHLLLPRAVEAVAASRITLGDDGRAIGAFAALPSDAAFTISASSADVLGRQLESALVG